jgi:hypothetical protein
MGYMLSIFDHFDTIFDDMFRMTRPKYSYYTDDRVVDDGEKCIYYKNGLVSRLDGPAIEYHDAQKVNEWYVNGIKKTEKEVKSLYEEVIAEKEHTLYIDGKRHTIKGKKLKELRKMLE